MNVLWKLFSARRLTFLDSLHASAPEKSPEAHETGDLQMGGLSGWLSLERWQSKLVLRVTVSSWT